MAAGVVLSASYPQLLNANRSATATAQYSSNSNNGFRSDSKSTTVTNTNRGSNSPTEVKPQLSWPSASVESCSSSSSQFSSSQSPSCSASASNVCLSDSRVCPSSSSFECSSSLSVPRGRVPLSSVVNCLVGKWSDEYLSSAKSGDLDSMCLVAQMYLGNKGWGRIQPNEVEGKKWIEKAKEATHKSKDFFAEKAVNKLEETLCPIQRNRATSENTSGSNTSGNDSPLHQPRAIHSHQTFTVGISSLPPPLLVRTPSPSILSSGNMSSIDDSNLVSDRSGYATSDASACPTPIARTPSAGGASTPRALDSIGNGLRSSFSSVLSLLTSPAPPSTHSTNSTMTTSKPISRSVSSHFAFSSHSREHQWDADDVEPTSAPIHPRSATSVAAQSAAASVLAPSTHTLHHSRPVASTNSANLSPQSRAHPPSHAHHPLHFHSSHSDYQDHDYAVAQALSHSYSNPHQLSHFPPSHSHVSGVPSSRVGAAVPSSHCISHASGYSSSSANSMGSGSGVSSGDEGGFGLGSGSVPSAALSALKLQLRSRSPSPAMLSTAHADPRDQRSPSFVPSQRDSMMPMPQQGNPTGPIHHFRHHQHPHVFAS